MKKGIKWLKKNWQDERKKSAIKLALYFIMMLFIVLLLVILNAFFPQKEIVEDTNTIVEQEIKKEPLTFSEIVDNILKNNYSYTYEINNNDVKTIYRGVKFKEKEFGTKENSDSLIKYYIDSLGTYKLSLSDKILINDLFLNVDQNYLSFNYIYELIKSSKTIKEVKEDITINHYTIINNNSEIYVNLYYNDQMITKVEIESNNIIYKLIYRKIGEITENDLGD